MKIISYIIHPDIKMKLDSKTKIKYLYRSMKLDRAIDNITGIFITLFLSMIILFVLDGNNYVTINPEYKIYFIFLFFSIFFIPFISLILLGVKSYYSLPNYENISLSLKRILIIRKNEYAKSKQRKEIQNLVDFLISSLKLIENRESKTIGRTLTDYRKVLKKECYNIFLYCSLDSVKKVRKNIEEISEIFHKTEYSKLIHIFHEFKKSIEDVKELNNIPQPPIKGLVQKIKYKFTFEKINQILDKIMPLSRKVMIIMFFVSVIMVLIYSVFNPSESFLNLILSLIKIPK